MVYRYLPMTEADRQDMLKEVGVSSMNELFSEIPLSIRLQKPLNLLPALSEAELMRHLGELAGKNLNFDQVISFLGAGMYEHYIPAVIDHVLSRSEFYTAYTPYQPELSQGELQAIFEYQSMICELSGMDVSNSSMYDGPTAMAEAALMAVGATGRGKVLVARTVQPEARAILQTYLKAQGIDCVEVPFEEEGARSGGINARAVKDMLDEKTACVIVQTPNFFGVLEEGEQLSELAHANRSLLVAYTNPISLGVIRPPGAWGADIVAGDAQPLGIPVSFGGPSCGYIASRQDLLRRLPGRIVGQTQDAQGKRGFVMTLQAREQHIRREKATSNICSNQALNALAVAVYLSVMGKKGIREVGVLNLQKAHYAHRKLSALRGVKATFQAPFFNEFVVRLNRPAGEVISEVLDKGFLAGFDLGRAYSGYENRLLVAVTEVRNKQEIDRFAETLEGLL